MRIIYRLFIFIIILSIFLSSVIAAGSVKKICPFTPKVIKCTPLVCENGKFTRTCIDITGCWNNGKEFDRKGSCQSDYKPKERQTEEEKQIQEFVNYEDDLPSINEGEIELISADLISGNLDSGFEQTQILEKTVEIPENYEKEKGNLVSYLIVFFIILILLFFVIRKRRSKFGGFTKEIGNLK